MTQATIGMRERLDRDGYVVVRTGIESELLAAVVRDIWQHVGADPHVSDSWYVPEVIRPETGMVEMYHYQSMWDIRQHPKLYGIFKELHGRPDLWVSIDRVACKPPVRGDRAEYDQSGFIHWDTDMSAFPDIPLAVQGVLALEDTDADMGGFQCVPSAYRDQERFLETVAGPGGLVPRSPALGDHPVVQVPLRAGEIVIWKTTLLHGNGRNTSTRPRLAQYVSMNPRPEQPEAREERRASRLRSWSECRPPEASPFPGDRRRIEETRARPAHLDPLGLRLLGELPWESSSASG